MLKAFERKAGGQVRKSLVNGCRASLSNRAKPVFPLVWHDIDVEISRGNKKPQNVVSAILIDFILQGNSGRSEISKS